MDNSGNNRIAQWTALECPFTIEYAVEVLDDIRLSVVDAFFSMSKGGVEIGGILLGEHRPGRVSILSSAPIECEHAAGPSFTLSELDLAKLEEQLAALHRDGYARPVGWYHSHTRSGIFLSDADLEIHRRFFPEPWQVALVLKPDAVEPVHAGFFFRDIRGDIHESGSHPEFVLDPLPIHPMPGAQSTRRPASLRDIPMEETGPVLDTTLVDATMVEAERPPQLPAFGAAVEEPAAEPLAFQTAEDRNPRSWPAVAVVIAGLMVGTGGFLAYQKRAATLPRSGARPVPATAAPAVQLSVGLSAIDSAGQLQIRWDRNALPVRRSAGAILTITDGDRPQTVALDAEHLRAGTFTYGRLTGHVDVALTIRPLDAAEIREVTRFMGPPPPAVPAVENRTQPEPQVKNAEEIRREMMRRRMEAQIPDADKKQ